MLPAVEFACICAVHDSTGQTPIVLNYGRQLPTPMECAAGDEVPAAHDFVGAMGKAIEDAKHILEKAEQRQKSYTDCCHHDIEF